MIALPCTTILIIKCALIRINSIAVHRLLPLPSESRGRLYRAATLSHQIEEYALKHSFLQSQASRACKPAHLSLARAAMRIGSISGACDSTSFTRVPLTFHQKISDARPHHEVRDIPLMTADHSLKGYGCGRRLAKVHPGRDPRFIVAQRRRMLLPFVALDWTAVCCEAQRLQARVYSRRY